MKGLQGNVCKSSSPLRQLVYRPKIFLVNWSTQDTSPASHNLPASRYCAFASAPTGSSSSCTSCSCWLCKSTCILHGTYSIRTTSTKNTLFFLTLSVPIHLCMTLPLMLHCDTTSGSQHAVQPRTTTDTSKPTGAAFIYNCSPSQSPHAKSGSQQASGFVAR